MKKFVKVMSVALVLAFLSTMVSAPIASAEYMMDIDMEFFDDIFVVEEIPFVEFNDMVIIDEAPADAPDADDFVGSVNIYMTGDTQIFFGDTVTLFADAEANMGYTIRWDAHDGAEWETVGYGETYSFEVNETNAAHSYRAVLVRG